VRYWLRGKRGGLIGFLAIAALVLGGLGWVTATVLDLEQEQRRARAEADLAARLRLALWQLDSFILPDLTREDVRPYSYYGPGPLVRADRAGAPALVNGDAPDWVLMHFQADDRGWKSPQLAKRPPAEGRKGDAPIATSAIDRKREQVLAELKRQWTASELLALVPEHGPALEMPDNNALVQANIAPNQGLQSQQNNDYEKRRQFQNRTKQEAYQAPFRGKLTVRMSRQMVPVWLTKAGRPERLVVMRRVQVGTRQMCQGIVLDWPRLQEVLAEQVADLFPHARLVAMREQTPSRPERTMTALPIELDPGESASGPTAGWTPLRIGLAVAWSAVLIALAAVGVGGWSLLDLSERRSRFVSAVTHELRTPLTTLRLYLDMLTSGMVQEEKQRADYLHTLHTEADRLNRLIANVLDFSRLENQRPRQEKGSVTALDLLEELRVTWQARCQDAEKELVIDDQAGAGASVVTDVRLVQQIVGNLIDNACKYSRDAEDRRVWLRARREGRSLVVEVEDHGPGIAAGERRALFSPFRRGRNADVTAGGVGLGLALAQRWARLLGGKLTLRSGAANGGACFRLELPA
jgi:signal transduction histidine kinase